MSKNKKIYRPKRGAEVPETPSFDMETGQRLTVDKGRALSQWLKSAKKDNKSEEESYSANIDPKQAFYAKKERKD